jgi:peptidoglycan/xylan/chitin deacetylase (PgdA/CDA1 family)
MGEEAAEPREVGEAMRNIFLGSVVLISGVLLLPSLALAQYDAETAPSERFPWPEGRRVALSLTFDDARLSQVDAGIPLLDRHGLKATFYVSPRGVEPRFEGWKAAVAAGHEVGNHSSTHPCTGNYPFSRGNALEDYTLERMALDIDGATRGIERLLGVRTVSFAYPCGQKFVGRGLDARSYVPLIARTFRTGRGWLGESSNDPWICDMAQLLGMESDGKSYEDLRALIEEAAEGGRWLILAGHEMADAGPQATSLKTLEALARYVADPANGIWVETVGAVAEYVVENRRSSEDPEPAP